MITLSKANQYWPSSQNTNLDGRVFWVFVNDVIGCFESRLNFVFIAGVFRFYLEVGFHVKKIITFAYYQRKAFLIVLYHW